MHDLGSIALMRLGARRAAGTVARTALAELDGVTPDQPDTTQAEALGTLHLTAALIAARDGNVGDMGAHLAEARDIAARTGERNHLHFHFGAANGARQGRRVPEANHPRPDQH